MSDAARVSSEVSPKAAQKLARPPLGKSLRIAVVVLLVAGYPFLLAEGLDHLSARSIGTAMLLAALSAAVAAAGEPSRLLSLLLRRFGLLVALAFAAAASDHPLALQMLPSVSSLWLLFTFGSTLRREPSLVGQFAIAMHDGFPDFLLPYCRKVTWMWCIFFALNAAIGTLLAFAAPKETWAFYTGVVAYAAMGLLGTAEYFFHKSRFRFYENGWADRIWRRLLPPEGSALGRRTLEWQLVHQPSVYGEPRA